SAVPLRHRSIGVCAEERWRSSSRRTCGLTGRKEDIINIAEDNLQQRDHSDCKGKLYVVGVGPGSPLDRTPRAEAAIAASDVIVGYSSYIELIADLIDGKEVISSSMLQEVKRCANALHIAASGKVV